MNALAQKQERARIYWLGQKLCWLSVLILFTGVKTFAQTIISPLWPVRGVTTVNQLWSVSLLSPQGETFMAVAEMNVFDAASGTPIFTATSNQFSLVAGVSVLSLVKVQPVSYSNLNVAYRINPSGGGLVPPGIFNVCYRILRAGGEVASLQGEGCFTLENDPLTPPSLLIPAENDSVQTSRPSFSWLPPVPASALANLNYTIRVAERTAYQSAQEAVERNLPVFTRQGMAQNMTVFPSDVPQLDTGKQYAWQILAYNGGNYVGASECWLFSLAKRTTDSTRLTDKAFVPLTKDGITQVVSVTDQLHFSYQNETEDSLLHFVIAPQDAPADSGSTSIYMDLPASAGNNYFTVDLTGKGLKTETIYTVQIFNSRNERWWALFKWIR